MHVFWEGSLHEAGACAALRPGQKVGLLHQAACQHESSFVYSRHIKQRVTLTRLLVGFGNGSKQTPSNPLNFDIIHYFKDPLRYYCWFNKITKIHSHPNTHRQTKSPEDERSMFVPTYHNKCNYTGYLMFFFPFCTF